MTELERVRALREGGHHAEHLAAARPRVFEGYERALAEYHRELLG